MALKLDDRPGQIYDPEEESKKVPEDAPDDGLEDAWNQSNEPSEDDRSSNIADAERNASSSDGQESAVGEGEPAAQESPDDQVGKGFTGKVASSSGGMSSKKKKGILAGVSVSIAGMLIAGFMAFPGFIINQIREVMTGKIGDLQTRQSLKYRRAKLAKISDVFSKDGRLGGGVITEMEARGYKFRFDPSNKNRVLGVTLPDGRSSLFGNAVGEHISDYMEVRHPLRTSRWKTKRMNALYNRFNISRFPVVEATPNDLDEAGDTLRSRMANTLDGEDVEVQTRVTDLPEEASDEQIARANGVEASNDTDGMFDDLSEGAKDGKKIEEVSQETADLARSVATGVDPGLHEAAEALAGGGSVGGKALSGLKSLSATDLADRVCTIKGRLRAVVTAARTKRAIELMRYAAAFIGAADSTRKGGTSGKLLSELFKSTTALDRNGNSIGASPGFAYAIKNKFSKGKNDSTRAGIAVDGKLTGVYGSIQDTTDGIPATSKAQCNVWQNPVVQIGAGIVEVALSIFSGGSSTATITGSKVAVTTTIKGAIKSSISKAVAKSLLKTIAFQAAIELSFEGIMTMTQIYAEKTLAYNFSGQEVGGELGDILTAGAGTLNKQRSLQAGMVPATTEQYAAVHDEYMATLAQERSQQSIFARYFDIYNVDSLAATAFMQAPTSTEAVRNVASTGFSGLLATPKTIASSFTNALLPNAYAQDADEIAFDTFVTEGDNSGINLATDHAGNLLPIMRTDIEAIDPEENISFLSSGGYIDPTSLEPLGTFKEHVENCVDGVDVISMIEATPKDQITESTDCLATLKLTIRFKAHLAYIDMLDAIESEFLPESIEEGIPQSGSNNPSTTLSAPGLNGYAIPCQGQPREVIRTGPSHAVRAVWDGIPTSGVIGTNSAGQPINVYIREACETTNVKTIFIGASIHGTENGGQFVAHELLFNADLPANIRIVAVPEINGSGITALRRTNDNGVDLNRNNAYNWSYLAVGSGTDRYKGTAPGSEPETQALNSFLTSLGRINLAIYYHDNIHYVAAVGYSTPLTYAVTYASHTPDTPVRGDERGRVFQSGSLDGWHNESTGTPALLVELSSNQSASIIEGHVSAVRAMAELGGL